MQHTEEVVLVDVVLAVGDVGIGIFTVGGGQIPS